MASIATSLFFHGKENANILTLGVKFNGDSKQLVFFITQVWTYMQEYGHDLLSKDAECDFGAGGGSSRVDGGLNNDDVPELCNFN